MLQIKQYVKVQSLEEAYELNQKKKKALRLQDFPKWCGRWDLNPYVIQHTPLKRACLPIPALPRIQFVHLRCNSDIIFKIGPSVNTFLSKSFGANPAGR